MLEGQADEAFPEGVDAPPEIPPPFTPPPFVPTPSAAPPAEVEGASSFPEQHKQLFEGLLFVGQLSDEITVAGHKIVFRTLSSDEILAVGSMSAPWLGTESSVRAYVTAVVGACITTIDRRPLPQPLIANPTTEDMVRDRFNWARGLNPFVQDRVYDAYRTLEAKVEEILDAMGGASG